MEFASIALPKHTLKTPDILAQTTFPITNNTFVELHEAELSFLPWHLVFNAVMASDKGRRRSDERVDWPCRNRKRHSPSSHSGYTHTHSSSASHQANKPWTIKWISNAARVKDVAVYDCDCDFKTSWGRCLRGSFLKLTAPYSSQISVRLAILVHKKTWN